MVQKNHGHLVTIASMAGIVGSPGLGDYCARFINILTRIIIELNRG